jgi:hypothetical protein
MTAEEFYKKWITVPRETEEICKFAEAYAKQDKGEAIEYIEKMEQEYEALQKQVDELKGEMRHALTFIRSREKMHPDGIRQFEQALKE